MFRVRLIPVLLLAISSSALAANQLPTDAELQQMLEKGDYRACLQQTARVLTLTGDRALKYDPFTLQMRRGECLLNLGDGPTAQSAYTLALKAAVDGVQAEQARAMISLLRVSRGLKYTAGDGETINIVPMDDRKRAMAAFFHDSLPAANQQLRTALDATVLNPLMDLFPKIEELHALEKLGTGSDQTTQPMLVSMGDRARDMIGRELRTTAERVEAIRSRADQLLASGNSTVTINGNGWWLADTRTGLSPVDRDTLRNTADYVDQILTVTRLGKQAAQSFGKDGKSWDPLINQAMDILDRAHNVLAAE